MKQTLKLPFQPKIVADSIYSGGTRLTTFLIPIPQNLIAELRTHRLLRGAEDTDLSINANSDRAIPIKTKIKQVEENPYVPIVTLANKGMTAIEEVDEDKIKQQTLYHCELMKIAINYCNKMADEGYSKQVVNRYLMPFAWSTVVITGDEKAWESFFKLRCADDVEPNFRFIAKLMKEVYENNEPVKLKPGDWHIAFESEFDSYSYVIVDLDFLKQKLIKSASYCARISYDTNRIETYEKHYSRAKMCINGGHTSVTEHQYKVPETRVEQDLTQYSTTKGWLSFRKMLEFDLIKI